VFEDYEDEETSQMLVGDLLANMYWTAWCNCKLGTPCMLRQVQVATSRLAVCITSQFMGKACQRLCQSLCGNLQPAHRCSLRADQSSGIPCCLNVASCAHLTHPLYSFCLATNFNSCCSPAHLHLHIFISVPQMHVSGRSIGRQCRNSA